MDKVDYTLEVIVSKSNNYILYNVTCFLLQPSIIIYNNIPYIPKWKCKVDAVDLVISKIIIYCNYDNNIKSIIIDNINPNAFTPNLNKDDLQSFLQSKSYYSIPKNSKIISVQDLSTLVNNITIWNFDNCYWKSFDFFDLEKTKEVESGRQTINRKYNQKAC